MRTRQISFRVTWKLYEQLNLLCREQGFKNISRFITALCLVAIQDKRRKAWVRGIANADPKLQDYLIDKMLAFPQDMEGMLKILRRLDEEGAKIQRPKPGPATARPGQE